MTLWKTLKVVWSNILGNRMRTFLTMFGMIIGVASVIILVSLMQGFYGSIIDSYAEMGINNVSVTITGRNGNMMIDENDMYQYAERNSDTIKGVMPVVNVGGVVNKGSKKIENIMQMRGIDENYFNLFNKKIKTGRPITYSDISTRQKVCVIGSYINKELFKGKAKAGDTIYLDGEEITVIGILEEISNSSEWSDDNSFYLPYTTAMRLTGTGTVSSYEFYIKNGEQVSAETTKMQKYLFGIFHDKKAYSVTNMIDMLKEINQEMSILTNVIAGIAGISLLVAGIGIMNIMLVSVSERTKEIGIRKSLGAKYKDIMRQFVLEAGTTSTIGGLVGILLGLFIAIKAGGLFKLKIVPNSGTVMIAFGVSVGIGILFGYLPARKAAKLNPIDALRSE